MNLSLVFLIGVSLLFSFPPYGYSALVFVSIAIFIIGLEKTKHGFAYGYVFYLGAVIAFIGYWFSYYFQLQLGTGYLLSYALTSVICLYTSLYIGIICLIYKRIRTTSPIFNLCALIPSLWVLTELIRGFFFPRSWYALGNTQVNSVIFRGYYPIFGAYFVSWLVVAISGLIACTLLTYKKELTLLKLIVCLSIFTGFSSILALIHYTKPYGKPITVALVQPSIFSTSNFSLQKLLEIEETSKNLVEKTNADLIVLPETVFGMDYHYLSPGYLDKLREEVNSKHQVLIFGSPMHFGLTPHRTGLVNIENPESPIYVKHYLVPFGEYNPLRNTFMEPILYDIGFRVNEYIAGSYRQAPVEILGQKFAFNVCYENTVNDYVADNARNATILLNQSDLSWYGKTQMKDVSLQFSQGRALENQRYFLQDGNTGDTAIINPKGKLEYKLPAFTSNTLVGTVQGYSGTTPFEIFGNIPIWLICCINILLAIKYREKRNKAPN